MPRVSFVVTAYEVAPWIATAVQSARDTGGDAEILVVDDGSGDMTPNIVRALGAMRTAGDAPVIPLTFSRNTVGGTGSAGNFGLDHATGEILVLLDGDDWALPGPLARAIARLGDEGLDLLVTDCAEYWNDTGRHTRYPEAHLWDELAAADTDAARRGTVLRMAPFPWRKVYRRAFIEEHRLRFPVGDWFFEDNPFHWEAVLAAGRWGWHREVTHIHRRARAGQTLARRGTAPLAIFDHFDTIRAGLEARGQQEARAPELCVWLLRHVPWCAAHCAPGMLLEVFAEGRRRLALFEPATVAEALRVHDPGAAEMRKLAALILDEPMAFVAEEHDPAAYL